MYWYLKVLKNYAVFKGRARRKEYWMFFLVNLLILFFVTFGMGILGILLGFGKDLGLIANKVYVVALLIPAFAVAVRRLHDTGRSGWWSIVPIVSYIFLVLDSQSDDNEYGPNPKASAPSETLS